MKIRQDFVSNSSSSSYVISVPKNKFIEFRTQIGDKSHSDYRHHNLKVIRNYLNSNHVSLFGGVFISDYKTVETTDPKDYFFQLLKKYDEGKLDNDNSNFVRDNLSWKDDTKTVAFCKVPIRCYSRVTDDSVVQKILEIKDDNEFLNAVMDPESIKDEYGDFCSDATYVINRKTIEVAIRLRKLGKQVFMFCDKSFEIGDEFITNLLKLTEDNSIYRIGITMSGDGVDEDSIRKEDNIESCSDFFEGFTILDTEYM